MPKNIEIEIQVQLENIRPLKTFLNKKAKLIKSCREIDTYYTPKHRNFLEVYPVSEWFRIRKATTGNSLNYKKWYYEKDGRSHYADEYETDIGNCGQVEKMLGAMDFKEVAVVDKNRKYYRWKKYIFTMDSIKGLGEFVEIEYAVNTKKLAKEITGEMIKFLKDLGVGKVTRNYNGYPYILLFPKKIKYEEY